MPVHTKVEWEAWEQEQANFKARDTQGFTQDMKALEAHIRRLLEVCPKDSAGWPVGTALNVVNKLWKDLETFKRYLDQLR